MQKFLNALMTHYFLLTHKSKLYLKRQDIHNPDVWKYWGILKAEIPQVPLQEVFISELLQWFIIARMR